MKQQFRSVGVELVMSNDYSFLLGSKDTKGMSNIFEKKVKHIKIFKVEKSEFGISRAVVFYDDQNNQMGF